MVLGTHGVLNKCLFVHEQTKGSVIEVVNTGKKKGPNNEADFFFCTFMNSSHLILKPALHDSIVIPVSSVINPD